jgi:hypothetical protein
MASMPLWFTQLPPHLRPPDNKIAEIEAFRKKNLLPTEAIVGGICSSPWAIVRTQEQTREHLKQSFPNADERRLWGGVLVSRFEIKMRSPSPWDPPAEELMRRVTSVDSIIEDIHSWDELMEYIVGMDQPSLDNNPLLYELDMILSPTKN